jgi:membrane protease YdiL (CAAX protease family)
MDQLTSDQITRHSTELQTPVAARRTLIWIAWLATLLVSNLPLVIARDWLGTDLPWINAIWMGAVILLIVATYLWSVLKPLRSYFTIMGVIILMAFVILPFAWGTEFWQSLTAAQSPMVELLAYRVTITLATFIVLACLLAMGKKPKEAFLTVGNLNAPFGGNASPTRKRVLTWPVFGTLMTLLLGGSFFAFLMSQIQGPISTILTSVVPLLPIILLSAALNAFSEEAMYRAAPLSTLYRVIGPSHALWLTSLWFGLGHYYGGFPSGLAGMIQSGLLGVLMGKAMLDTRGLGWPWMIHVVIDTIIYIFMAATMS